MREKDIRDLLAAADEVLNYAGMSAFLDSDTADGIVWGVTKKDLLRLRTALRKATGATP